MKQFAAVLFLCCFSSLHALPLDQATEQVTRLSNLIQKIINSPEALRQILAVKDGFYTDEGDLLRTILRNAAQDITERDNFVAGLKYEKCKKWFWQCGIPPISLDKIKFKFSSLKTNIDALETTLRQLANLPEDDFSDFDPRSLDPYEPAFGLYAKLEPHLGKLVNFWFPFYTEQSLQDLLAKLIQFLNDKENGALGFIREAKSRS